MEEPRKYILDKFERRLTNPNARKRAIVFGGSKEHVKEIVRRYFVKLALKTNV